MNGYGNDRGIPSLARTEAEELFEQLTRAARGRVRRRRANRSVGAGLSSLAIGATVFFGVLPLTRLDGPTAGISSPPRPTAGGQIVSPAGSTAGSRIAFVRVRSGHQHIFVMNPDGTHVRQLTTGSGDDWGPAWKPGGKQLAFFRCDPDHNYDCDVYVIHADGTGLKDLVAGPTDTAHPAWSPDGTKIAFTQGADDGIQVYVMNADGTGITQLTHVGIGVLHPVWSPDASLIAFDTPIGSGKGRIGVVHPDGSGMRWLLTDGAGRYDVLRPGSWAPDGSAILFSRFLFQPGESIPSDVFVLTLADGRVHRVTADGSSEYPSWSPDGAEIALDSSLSGRHQIFKVEADGTGRTRLTNDPADDSNAVWSR